MMGLSSVVYWMSWFVVVLIYLVIACFIFTLLLSVKVSEHGSVLPHSDPTLTFIFFVCFAMSVTALSFMMSTFFKKGKNTNILLFPLITGWHYYLLTFMVDFMTRPGYVLLLQDTVVKEKQRTLIKTLFFPIFSLQFLKGRRYQKVISSCKSKNHNQHNAILA